LCQLALGMSSLRGFTSWINGQWDDSNTLFKVLFGKYIRMLRI